MAPAQKRGEIRRIGNAGGGAQVFKFFGIGPNYTRFEVSLRDKARFANPGLPIASFANSYYNKN